jgi:hypothetical protein
MEYKDLEKWVKSDLEKVLPGEFKFYKGPGVLGAKWKYDGGFKQILLSTVRYPPIYHIRGVSALMRFDRVEAILESILPKYKLTSPGIGETIKSTLAGVSAIDYSFSDVDIVDEESYGIVFAQVEKLMKSGALPFFEKYQALEETNRHIESLPINQLSGFVSGDVALKRLVIKRLCNNPDWADYGQMILQFFKENAVKEPQHYKNLDSVTQELMEVLLRPAGT